MIRSFAFAALSVLAGVAVLSSPAAAQDKPLRTDVPEALAKRLQAEGDARLACKKQICSTIKDKKADGDAIACKIVNTWVDVDLKERVLKGRMDWPWSHVQCEADIKLDRAMVAKMTAEAKFEAKIGKHKVSCVVDGKDGKENHKLSFSIDPLVTFEGGKATKAVLNWSEVDGTTLAKSTAWSATAADNTFGVLQGVVTDQINEFVGPKCAELK